MHIPGPSILVAGADSMIGAALIAELEATGWPVTGTGRRAKRDDKTLELDLADDMAHWESPARVDVLVICAGVTGMGECADDPEGSRKVNVDGISALAENFVAKGSFVIHLSSNQVFDGRRPFPPVDAAVSPITEYGRQKAEAERRILTLKNSVAILRMTKVLGQHDKLFETWLALLRKGEPIRPFSDVNFSPVPLKFVVSVLKTMAKLRPAGLFHLSGDKDVSYEYAARMAARMAGAKGELVRPLTAQSAEAYSEPQPKNTALDGASLVSFFGEAPPPVNQTLRAAFTEPGVLRPKP